MPKKLKVGAAFSLARFCMLRLKSKKRKGDSGHRLVELIEHKLRRVWDCLKEKKKKTGD